MPNSGALLSDAVPVNTAATMVMDSVGMHNQITKDLRPVLSGTPTTMEVIQQRQRSLTLRRLGFDTAVPETQHVKRVEIALNAPQKFGDSVGVSQDFIRLGGTSDELLAARDELFAADRRTINMLLLGACFAEDGFYYNGMADAPPPYKNNTFDTTHTHYAGYDVSGVPEIAHWVWAKHTIWEHGFTDSLVSFCHNATIAEVEGLAEWVSPTGEMISPVIQQLQVAGYTPSFMASGVPVVAEDWIPEGYVFVVAASTRKPVAWRIPKGPGAGDFCFYEDNTCPNAQYEWRADGIRYGAATVIEMGAGAVIYLGGASYVAPTCYDIAV